MRKPYFCAVIGKNFGDEGKGLAVDYLSDVPGKVLVIRHNGGAQSGHTVEYPDKRFVFHELASGSFRRADTFWADTYFPDLYKLGEEMEEFYDVAGFRPVIFADINAKITIIDDVLLNMAAESARGSLRHGSCGMGIYEAKCRSEAGFAITIKDLLAWTPEQCLGRLKEIRKNYLPGRWKELWKDIRKDLQVSTLQESPSCQPDASRLFAGMSEEYEELLQSDAVLENAVKEIYRNLQYVKAVSDVASFLQGYDRVIFENGQGLLLDSENDEFSPHVTASRTGLTNPCELLLRWKFTLDEVVYVTRSYVTRHGAGPLPCECGREELDIMVEDQTNIKNEWQGSLRYARHQRAERFMASVREDLKNITEQPLLTDINNCTEQPLLEDLHNHKKHHVPMPVCSLMITHLNETGNCILCETGNLPVKEFCTLPVVQNTFQHFYLSETRYAQDIKFIK